MLKTDLRGFTKQFSEYTELRAQENRTTRIVLVNGALMENATSATSGVSARVNSNGNWGFASNPIISNAAIEKVILAATENAAFLAARQSKGKQVLPSHPHSAEKSFYTTKATLEQKEKIEFVRTIDAYIAATYPDLTSRTLVAAAIDMEKNLVMSDGSVSYSMTPRSHMYIQMKKSVNGENFEIFDVFGGRGQFEDTFSDHPTLYDHIDKTYEHLINKTKGVFAEAGRKEVILDANVAGILAHEAIGHTTEADLVRAGSVAGPLLNKPIASPLINLVDFAHSYNGETCPVPVYVDDEGVKAEDQVIIEDGILKRYMHDKESAAFFGHAPTGNARAFEFSDEPLIRMRNTAILPGTSKREEMISSIEDGYYLIEPSNGQADLTSEFMFGIILGYEIKNGKLGKALRDTTISGIAIDVLKSVTMVSDDMAWKSGWCGKKQMIPVGLGGPAIKCNVNMGGK